MANEQRHAYITIQGNVNSKKCYDPSGFVVMSPFGFKTFRNSRPAAHDGMKAAVLWAMKQGFTVHLVKPNATARNGGQLALLDQRFLAAQAIAAAAVMNVSDEAPRVQPLRVGAQVRDGSILTL